jgi:hypothetical protein
VSLESGFIAECIRIEERFQIVAVSGILSTPVADFSTFRMSRHRGWKTVLFFPAWSAKRQQSTKCIVHILFTVILRNNFAAETEISMFSL